MHHTHCKCTHAGQPSLNNRFIIIWHRSRSSNLGTEYYCSSHHHSAQTRWGLQPVSESSMRSLEFDSYPILRMYEFVESLGRAWFIATLDLTQATGRCLSHHLCGPRQHLATTWCTSNNRFSLDCTELQQPLKT